jgi:hypothetical protein
MDVHTSDDRHHSGVTRVSRFTPHSGQFTHMSQFQITPLGQLQTDLEISQQALPGDGKAWGEFVTHNTKPSKI